MRNFAQGAMRRKEREITDRTEIDALIYTERLMHIALVDGDQPFLVPVFYAYDGTALYFHSALAGTKIGIIRRNPRICFEICADHGIIESDDACNFDATYRTVIGSGCTVLIDDEQEKIRALDLIVARFTETKGPYSPSDLDQTAVIRIDIHSIQGKKHGC
jgi:nitroimidazol reductase NimA-like FMN-containing flavoprotein (pyridoxamine 5'-phosphate oxidase superfamily)